eukprot:10633552-Lingulodinium_polyedra.AAC.1
MVANVLSSLGLVFPTPSYRALAMDSKILLSSLPIKYWAGLHDWTLYAVWSAVWLAVWSAV